MTLKKPVPERRLCACGCRRKLTGTARQQYVNTAHRMRALRRRAAVRTPAA